MDSIQYHRIKLQKSRKAMNPVPLRAFTSMFRLVELLVLLVLVSKLFFQIPVAMKFSGDVFREASVFLVSPSFVFVLGNAIVITLFAKSGRYSDQDPSDTAPGTVVDVHQEFRQKNEKRSEIEKREEQRAKRVCFEERICRRSRSEKSLEAVKHEKCGGKLKRYESDKYPRICDSDKELVKCSSYAEDGMNHEEFRNKIEAFIARQKRFQKDEEYVVI